MRDTRLWLFQRLFGLCALIAWASLGSQILLLIGERGLLPFAPVLERIDATGLGFWQLPSVFRWGASDPWLVGGCWVGAGLSLLALCGIAPRTVSLLNVGLYLSYAEVTGPFLGFQWDNLLIEAGMLVALLPVALPDVRAALPLRWLARMSGGAWGVFLLRVLVFKLYFESGLAKLQSPAGDWLDGSAMSVYYETAPLPGPLAWYAHALPAWFHRLESWATLGFELFVPWLSFGSRRPRLLALAVLSLFQVVNIVSANYGFFAYLALALHVALLDDSDLRSLLARWPLSARLGARLDAFARAASLRSSFLAWRPPAWSRWQSGFALALCSIYVLISVQQGVQRFVGPRARLPGLELLLERIAHLRVINTYHLFAQITLERIEPTFAVQVGDEFRELALRYKPGPTARGLPLVAPHQPRVDFLLWFYGLRFRGAPPNYVKGLLNRLCREPAAVSELFVEPLPPNPEQVHLDFWQYHFTSPTERQATGNLWKRTKLEAGQKLECTGRRRTQ
jgi:hypothetical protein